MKQPKKFKSSKPVVLLLVCLISTCTCFLQRDRRESKDASTLTRFERRNLISSRNGLMNFLANRNVYGARMTEEDSILGNPYDMRSFRTGSIEDMFTRNIRVDENNNLERQTRSASDDNQFRSRRQSIVIRKIRSLEQGTQGVVDIARKNEMEFEKSNPTPSTGEDQRRVAVRGNSRNDRRISHIYRQPDLDRKEVLLKTLHRRNRRSGKLNKDSITDSLINQYRYRNEIRNNRDRGYTERENFSTLLTVRDVTRVEERNRRVNQRDRFMQDTFRDSLFTDAARRNDRKILQIKLQRQESFRGSTIRDIFRTDRRSSQSGLKDRGISTNSFIRENKAFDNRQDSRNIKKQFMSRTFLKKLLQDTNERRSVADKSQGVSRIDSTRQERVRSISSEERLSNIFSFKKDRSMRRDVAQRNIQEFSRRNNDISTTREQGDAKLKYNRRYNDRDIFERHVDDNLRRNIPEHYRNTQFSERRDIFIAKDRSDYGSDDSSRNIRELRSREISRETRHRRRSTVTQSSENVHLVDGIFDKLHKTDVTRLLTRSRSTVEIPILAVGRDTQEFSVESARRFIKTNRDASMLSSSPKVDIFLTRSDGRSSSRLLMRETMSSRTTFAVPEMDEYSGDTSSAWIALANTVKIILSIYLIGQIFIDHSKKNKLRFHNVISPLTMIKEKVQ